MFVLFQKHIFLKNEPDFSKKCLSSYVVMINAGKVECTIQDSTKTSYT